MCISKTIPVMAAITVIASCLCAPKAAVGATAMIASAGAADITLSAQSAILMDGETGRVLWEKNAHEPMAMASTTKILSCLVALENTRLSDIVTVSERAAGQPRVKMFLAPGEKISMESLLLALMLQSSNDAAVAIAEHVGGSVEGFAELMNEKALSLGAMESLFVTPNGLDEGGHHSTAYDMAVITRAALANPEFRRIISTREAAVNSDRRKYDITNKNRLLNEYDGANGVKTGYTSKAGQCFVGAAKRQDMQLISVVFASGWGDMGREQKWVDSKKLLNYGFERFSLTNIIKAGDRAADVAVTRAKETSVAVMYAGSLRLPLTAEERESARVSLALPETLKAPIDAGVSVGAATIDLQGCSFYIDVVTESPIERFDLQANFEKTFWGFLSICGREAGYWMPDKSKEET